MRSEESIIQKHCVAWFRMQHQQYAGLLFAIPNGGQRKKATAGIIKAEGVVRGVADLFLSVPRGQFHGMYVEMKTYKGRQSPEQVAFENAVIMQGYRYEVCHCVEDFIHEISTYLTLK
jgi:hypothetical protein